MGIQDVSTQSQRVRDELGSEPTVHEIHKIKTEDLVMIEHPLQVTSSTIGESWIVGSSTNGIVGTNTGTQSGLQQVVGGSGRVETVEKVLPPNDTVFEPFNFTLFQDTGNTDATWSGDGNLIMATGQTATSLTVYKDVGTVSTATMDVTLSGGSVSDLTLLLTADGGTNYEQVTDDTEHNFANPGTDLRWRISASTGAVTATTVKINFIKA